MTIDEIIAVLQAFKDGKAIQFAVRKSDPRKWLELSIRDLAWNFASYEYRVKPEPRTIWVNEYPDGSGTVHHSDEVAVRAAHGCCPVRAAVKYVEVIDE